MLHKSWQTGFLVLVIALAPLVIALPPLAFLCSSDQSHSDAEQASPPKGKSNSPPSTFEMVVTKDKKIRGSYYPAEIEEKKHGWARDFVCHIKGGEFALAEFTWLLFLATGLLSFGTLKLWRATENLSASTSDLVVEAKNTAKRELRAYVAHDPNGAHFHHRTTQQVGYRIVGNEDGPVKYFENNFGQTPASEIKMFVKITGGIEVPKDVATPLAEEFLQDVIGYAPPGQNIGRIIEIPDKTEWLKGKKFFLHGHVDYNDIFKRRWRHYFAFSHDHERGATTGERWVAHGKHHYERRLRKNDDKSWRECPASDEDD